MMGLSPLVSSTIRTAIGSVLAASKRKSETDVDCNRRP